MRWFSGTESARDERNEIFSGWRLRAVIWSALLAAIGYMCFALWGGWQGVVSAIGRLGVAGIVITLALSLVNYGLRFIRWQSYLRVMGHPVLLEPSLKIYIAGFALTTTPGKAGEALRGVFLKRYGVPYATSFAAFLSERLSDLLAIVLLTILGLTHYSAAVPLISVGAAAVFLAFIVLSNQRLLEAVPRLISGASRLHRLVRDLIEVLLQARRCHSPIMLAKANGLSLIAWGAEAFAFYLILQWLGLEISFTFAAFIYAVSMLAGALSFMPGGLIGAEGAMMALLIWSGVDSADAIAATVVIRLATLWFAVVLGICALSRFGIAHSEPEEGNSVNGPIN